MTLTNEAKILARRARRHGPTTPQEAAPTRAASMKTLEPDAH